MSAPATKVLHKTWKKGARKASEQTESLIRTAAKATAQNAGMAAEHTETFRQASDSMTQRAADQFLNVFGFSGDQTEQAVRAPKANIDAIAKSTSVVAEGAQTVSQECLSLASVRMERNLKQWERFVRCRSLNELAAAQTELLREDMEQTLCSIRRLAEISMHTADNAAKQMIETVEQTQQAA